MARDITIKILGEDSSFKRALGSAESAAQGFSSRMSALGGRMRDLGSRLSASVTLPIVALGAVATNWAIDAAESANKVNEVFQAQAEVIHGWSQSAANDFGISRGEAEAAFGSIGTLLQGLGFEGAALPETSRSVVQLATDLGSFHNLSTTEVLDQISGAFRGEYDSLQALLPGVNAAAVEHQALAMGLEDANGEISANAQATALMALMYDQAGPALGDFSRTSNGAANATRIATARLKDAAVAIADDLVPVVAKVAEWVSKLADKFSNLSPTGQKVVLIVLALAAAIGPVISLLGAVATAIAFIASPVGLVVAAIAALIAIFVYLYKTNDDFRELVHRVIDSVVAKWNELVAWARVIWPQVQEAIAHVVAVIKELWARFGDDILRVAKAIWGQIYNHISFVISMVKGIIEFVLAVINGDWGAAWDAIKAMMVAAWDYMKGTVQNALSFLQGVLGGAWEAIKGQVHAAWSTIAATVRGGVGWIIDAVRALPGGIANIASGAFDAVWNAFRSVINRLIGAWNNLSFTFPSFSGDWNGPLPGGGFTTGGWTIRTPRIQPLAAGGIVMPRVGGVPAILAEAGRPEAVIPLDRLGAFSGNTYVVHVTVEGSLITERELDERIRDSLYVMQRRNASSGFD